MSMKRFMLALVLVPLVVGAISCDRNDHLGDRDSGAPPSSSPGGASGADPSCPAGLDLGFGQQGRYAIESGLPIVEAVLVQPDGQVVAVGEGAKVPFQGDSPTVFAALRLLADGRPDPSFGLGGTATAQLLPNGRGDVRGGALQSDGKVIVLGSAYPGGDTVQWLVARFNQDGSLDTSFGSAGVAPSPIANAFPTSVGMVDDGSFLVAGTVRVPLPGYCCDGNVVLAKYDAQGRLDPGFGAGGFVTTPVGLESGDDYASAIVLQADGHVVVGGTAFVPADDGDGAQEKAMLLRYTAAGVLDPAFGADGVVLISSYQAVNAVALQGDGKLLVSLSTGVRSSELVVGRYTTAGARDLAFGRSGVTRIGLPPANGAPQPGGASALFSLRDGSILLAGPPYGPDFFLAKLGADGALDGAFGTHGIIATTPSAGVVAIAPDGKTVVVGSRSVDADDVAGIERYCL